MRKLWFIILIGLFLTFCGLNSSTVAKESKTPKEEYEKGLKANIALITQMYEILDQANYPIKKYDLIDLKEVPELSELEKLSNESIAELYKHHIDMARVSETIEKKLFHILIALIYGTRATFLCGNGFALHEDFYFLRDLDSLSTYPFQIILVQKDALSTNGVVSKRITEVRTELSKAQKMNAIDQELVQKATVDLFLIYRFIRFAKDTISLARILENKGMNESLTQLQNYIDRYWDELNNLLEEFGIDLTPLVTKSVNR